MNELNKNKIIKPRPHLDKQKSFSVTAKSAVESFETLKKLMTKCGGNHNMVPLSYWNSIFDCPAKIFLPYNHTFMIEQGKSISDSSDKVRIGTIGFPGQQLDFIVAQMFFLHPMPYKFGRYLEIGAYYGLQFSNTLFFEQYLGWNGWLFEPTTCFEACVKNRPFSSVFKHGLCAKKQEMEFNGFGICKSRNASCIPLTSIPRDWHLGFDFMSIDVEGKELSVLEAIDFEKVPVKVLILEWRKKDGLSREKYLKQFGFVRLGIRQNSGWDTGDEFFYHPGRVKPHIFMDVDF